MIVPTNPQNSINVCQSRPLRASRDTSIASTAPTRASQIAASKRSKPGRAMPPPERPRSSSVTSTVVQPRSEEQTSELQSPDHLVCGLLLDKDIEVPTPDLEEF